MPLFQQLRYVESADKTYALNTVATQQFTATPKIWGAYLRCTSADFDYAVGQKIELATGLSYDGTTSHAMSIFLTGNTVSVAMRFYVVASTAAANGTASLTPANWALVIWAVV